MNEEPRQSVIGLEQLLPEGASERRVKPRPLAQQQASFPQSASFLFPPFAFRLSNLVETSSQLLDVEQRCAGDSSPATSTRKHSPLIPQNGLLESTINLSPAEK